MTVKSLDVDTPCINGCNQESFPHSQSLLALESSLDGGRAVLRFLCYSYGRTEGTTEAETGRRDGPQETEGGESRDFI